MNLVTLHNVVDTRTGKFHPVAIVYEKNAKYYVKEEEKENTNNDSIL